jgi:murein DD-endopeptidase MepM/ murein hydrolase activator NlpD
LKRILLFISLFLLAACRQQVEALPEQVSDQPSLPTITTIGPPTFTPSPPAPIATATAVFTSTPTVTPSPTPTPTATALPIRVSGDPRAALLANLPAPQRAAACGIVDILDFPIDPPDAANVGRGGGDFGVFRGRYDKFHAGEDWGGIAGQPNLDTPVHSIGHGRVMYAEPEGWNRDKGVVIIEHIFGDGRSFYSFYGHLDPPSVLLESGDCVRRGQMVGRIGQPRTPPHLHFEIRQHMPYQPGPGYWAEDPTLAGWLPPSQTIWNQRMAAAPGVGQLWPFIEGRTRGIGAWDAETFLILAGERLVALGVENGRYQPIPLPLDNAAAALARPERNLLLVADGGGLLHAFNRPDEAAAFAPLWQVALGYAGAPELWPLPEGGVVAVFGPRLVAVGPDGALVWRVELEERPFAWDATDKSLLIASANQTWAVTGDPPPQPVAEVGGHPLLIGGQRWLHAADGLYRLEPGGVELIYSLPPGQPRRSAAIALPDGGLLLLHADVFDRQLMAFNDDGSLRWQRSLRGQGDGDWQLVAAGDTIYLAAQVAVGAASELRLYELVDAGPALNHVFTGGTRAPSWGDGWVMPADAGRLILNPGGGTVLVFGGW